MFGMLTDFEGSLFDEVRRMEEQFDAMFDGWPWQAGIRSVARGSFPPINIGATADKVEVYLFAPGLDASTLEVSIQQNLLTVAGERRLELKENANYYRQERFSGAFRRVITLPEDVMPDGVQARYRDGVLHITVARQEAVKPRQIEVKAA
jgi:HSP20 family protein